MTEIHNSGSTFEDFLAEEGILDEVDEAAVKRVLAWELQQAMEQRGLNKSALAGLMDTSRSQVDRLLNPNNTSISLHTMFRAASVLGKRLSVRLEDEPERAA